MNINEHRALILLAASRDPNAKFSGGHDADYCDRALSLCRYFNSSSNTSVNCTRSSWGSIKQPGVTGIQGTLWASGRLEKEGRRGKAVYFIFTTSVTAQLPTQLPQSNGAHSVCNEARRRRSCSLTWRQRLQARYWIPSSPKTPTCRGTCGDRTWSNTTWSSCTSDLGTTSLQSEAHRSVSNHCWTKGKFCYSTEHNQEVPLR